MARVRSLKPSFFKDLDLAEKSMAARLFFAGLWCQADREGRLRDEPKFLKAEIFPYDDVDADALLSELAAPRRKKPGVILRYTVAGERFISIPSFLRHEKPYHKEAQSEIPSCPTVTSDDSRPGPQPDTVQTALSSSSVFGLPSSSSGPKDLAKGVATLPPLADEHDQRNTEKPPAKTADVWLAYSTAYRLRYGVEPVRNAKVNGQLASLISRIGAEEAPRVAGFYVESNVAFYVAQGHGVGLLLRDAEKLRTEWFTGTRITGIRARSTERTQENADVWTPFLRGGKHVDRR